MKSTRATVLLVEDEALIAMAEKRQLEQMGYVVDHVMNGEAAVATAVHSESQHDLILMDIDLGPGIDGTQAAERVLEQKDVPIVFLSSHTEPEVVEKTEKITSYGYVVKNSGITVLDTSIKMALRLFESKMHEQQHRLALLHWRDLMGYIIEHNQSAVAVHDRERKYVFVSKPYLDQYNLERRDIIGKHHYDIFPDLPQKFRDAHERALRGEVSRADDDRFEREDGTTLWTRWECRPWYEADGRIGGFIVYTEVLSTEQSRRIEARDTANYLQSVLRTCHDGFFLVGLDANLLDVNDAFCAMTGYSRGECLQLTVPDIEAIETPQDTAERIERIRATGSEIFQSRHRRKDGSVIDVEVSASFLGGTPDAMVCFSRDITDRKRAEEAVARAEADQRILLDNIPTQVWYLTDLTTYGAVNEAHVRFVGISREVLSFRDMRETLPEEVVEVCKKSNVEVFESGRTVHTEEWSPDASGTMRLLSVTKTPKLDDQGRVEYVVCSADDITERNQAEERLRESEERFQQLFNEAPLGYQSLDSDGKFIEVNQQWLDTLGYDRDEVIGRWFGDFLSPAYRDGFRARFPIFKAQGYIYSEFEMVHKSGRTLFIGFDGKIGHDSEGEFKRTHCILQDITDRRLAEQALRQSEAESRLLLDYSSAMIWSLRPDGTFMYASPSGAVTTGYDIQEMVGERFEDYLHPEDLADCMEYIRELMDTGGVGSPLTYRFRHADGSWHWHEATAACVLGQEGDVSSIVGVSRDITDRKRSQDENQRQLSEKEIILREVHHRIKNNISQIESLLSIRANTTDSAEVRAALQEAVSSVSGFRVLYERLLIEDDYQDVHMKDYLDNLIESLAAVYEEHPKVTVETRITDFKMSSKKAVPVGVILNELVTNVYKYAFVNSDKGHVSIDLSLTDTRATLMVHDDGVGFDDELGSNESSGIGLTIIRMLSAQLDGTFTIAGENGTKAVLTFEV